MLRSFCPYCPGVHRQTKMVHLLAQLCIVSTCGSFAIKKRHPLGCLFFVIVIESSGIGGPAETSLADRTGWLLLGGLVLKEMNGKRYDRRKDTGQVTGTVFFQRPGSRALQEPQW